jgi:hypothetical protein
MALTVRSSELVAEIDTTTGGVVGLRHPGRGLTLVGGPAGEAPFRLDVTGLGAVTEILGTTVEALADGVRAVWLLPHGITVTGEVRPRGEDLAFSVRADVAGDAVIERLTYPVLAGIGRLGGRGRDHLVHSHATGMLFHDPLDLLGPDPENRRKLRRSPYPEGFAGATMQFLAYYADGLGGFLFATEDAGRAAKWLDVERLDDGLCLSVIHKPDAPAAGLALEPAYPVIVAPLREGSWYEAGERYRAWAIDQAWARPVPRATWLREGVGLCTFGINAQHDRSRWLDAIHGWADSPVFHVLGPDWAAAGQDYRNHLPRGTQDWFPARFADANLATIRRNGDRWAPFEFDLLCKDPERGDEPVLASRYRMDDAESGISDGGLPHFPFMCPGTAYWHDWHVARDERLVRDHGADALYYDIAVNNVLLQCYAPGHDHAPGAGTQLAGAFEAMYLDTGRAMARAAGTHVPMGAEMISEQSMPWFDFYQARGESGPYAPFEVAAFRDWVLDGRAEKIPLFAYVYGERAPVRMDGWAKLSAETGDLFHWVAATVLLNGGLLEVNAEFSALEALDGATWHDPAEHYYPFADRRYAVDRAKAATLGAVARTRLGPANPFLARGRMVRPPDVETEHVELGYHAYNMSTTESLYDSTGRMRVPAVIAAGWQHEGRTIALIANVVDRPTEVRVAGVATRLGPHEVLVEGV